MKLSRPSTPAPCSPHSYTRKKAEILARVRDAIQARRWECKELHAVYPSIRRKVFEQLMDGDDWRFSMRFACSVAEAVGLDPWDDGSAVVLPAPVPLPTIKYVAVPVPATPPPRHLTLDLAA